MQAFVHFITDEWYFAVPMILMSFAGVALISWRILLNMSASTNMNEFLPFFQKKWEQEGEEEAKLFCKGQGGLIPRKMFMAGLDTYKSGQAAMKRSMAHAMELEIMPDLNFVLAWILAIAKIATMVGLLGTVISMIGTFSVIGEAAKSGNASGVTGSADKIGLALFATMFGLAAAIPLVFAHVLFKDWIYRFELKMKNAAQKFLLIVTNTKPGSNPAPADDKEKKPAAGAPRRPVAATERGGRRE